MSKRAPDMTTAEKVRENRARRIIKRRGMFLVKSRARDRRELTYGMYRIIGRDAAEAGILIIGRDSADTGRTWLSLATVEEFLKQ